MTIHDILSQLKQVKRSKEGWKSLCPAHEDRNPSLSVCERNGKVLLHCFAGCSYEEVVKSLGFSQVLERNGNFPLVEYRVPKSNSQSPIARQSQVATYDYTCERGEPIYQIVRNDITLRDGTRKKEFLARRRPSGDETRSRGGWIYQVPSSEYRLYNLHGIANEAEVWVVEGEKDVETLTKLGYAATCNPFGAGKWRDSYSEMLRDKLVRIIPDNDKVGKAHAEQVANSLDGIAREVLVIELPGLHEKEDVTDFFAKGGTAVQLHELTSSTKPWKATIRTSSPLRSSKFSLTSLDQLLDEAPEETSFVWDKTLPTAGFSICSAKPKVGKSTFARNLAVAVACGNEFFGRSTKQGKVIYLCLEEKRSEIRKHFELMAANTDQILIYTGSAPTNALVELVSIVKEIGPILVIIDPLSRIIRVNDFNDYGGMSRALEPLIDLGRSSGSHILALHHDSKMDRSGGDALLGSTALFGAVDCHIHMRKRDSARTIMTTQRYGEDLPETVIKLDSDSGTVGVVSDLAEFTQDRIKNKVMSVIFPGEVLTEMDVKARVDGHSMGQISKALRSLYELRQLERSGNGVKGSPYTYARPFEQET